MINPEIAEDERAYPLEGMTKGAKGGLTAAFFASRVGALSQLPYTGYVHKGSILGTRGLLGGAKPGTTGTPVGLTLGMAGLGYHLGGAPGALVGYVASGFMQKGLLEYAVGSDTAKEWAWGLNSAGKQVSYGVSDAGQRVYKYSGRYKEQASSSGRIYNKLRGRRHIYNKKINAIDTMSKADQALGALPATASNEQLRAVLGQYNVGFKRSELLRYKGDKVTGFLSDNTKIQRAIDMAKEIAPSKYRQFLATKTSNRVAHVFRMAHLGDFSPLTQMGKIAAGVPRNFLGRAFYSMKGKKINRLQETLTKLYSSAIDTVDMSQFKTSSDLVKWMEQAGLPRTEVTKLAENYAKQHKIINRSSAGLAKLTAMEKSGDKAIAGKEALVQKAKQVFISQKKAAEQVLSVPGKLADVIKDLPESMAKRQTLLTVEQTMASAAASYMKFSFAAQIGIELLNATVKGTWNLSEKLRSKVGKIGRLDFGSGQVLSTEMAMSERQRALQMIQSNHMMASSYLGNEANRG